jgi:nucleotide-binding universal stress UspA family protein
MSSRLLVPLTDSVHSWPGLEYALERFPDTEITVLNVVDPAGAGYGERSNSSGSRGDGGAAETQAEDLFEAAEELTAEHGTSLDTAVVEGRPAEAIVAFAEEHAIDGIVMGSRGRSGVSRVLLGSVAGTVVQDSPVPVTVVP